jgi:hypothetical protein
MKGTSLRIAGNHLQVYAASQPRRSHFFFFPVPVCAITASGVPGGTFVSMNREGVIMTERATEIG